jgi:site-specific DNA-methyltransferase (adenine-specific)
LAFLKKTGRPATTTEIHAAVEKAIGSDVPKSSVRSYLRLNTPKLFSNPSRGTYGLRK